MPLYKNIFFLINECNFFNFRIYPARNDSDELNQLFNADISQSNYLKLIYLFYSKNI